MKKVTIKHAKDVETATLFRSRGYEPVECSFGAVSVVGELKMDHHGEYSHLPGVAIRAHGELYGIRADDPRFVVTGSPDLDAVAAIAGLAGLLHLDPATAELINAVDTDPIGVGSLLEKGEAGLKTLAFNQAMVGQPSSEETFEKALELFLEIFSRPLSSLEKQLISQAENQRMKLVTSSALILWEHVEGEPVALAANPAWGFDVWYNRAPCVVAFVENKKSVTIGCKTLADAEALFGPGGLKNTYPVLDKEIAPGFGGRETVGGSPRGYELTLEEARRIKNILLSLIKIKR
ncbi:MAG: hypothetical protein QXI19_05630 [Candidatus Caldarchaeum sp.]